MHLHILRGPESLTAGLSRQQRRAARIRRLREDAERAAIAPRSIDPKKRARQELHAALTAKKAKRSHDFDFRSRR